MPNTPQVDFVVSDESGVVTPPEGGINGLLVYAKRGPRGTLSNILTTTADFEKEYGPISEQFPDTIQAKIALDNGSKLRVVNVGEDDGMGGFEGDTAVGDTSVVNSIAEELFTFEGKYPGAGYNGVTAAISAAISGIVGNFDIVISLPGDTTAKVETYRNLTIVGTPTIAESTYLDVITRDSKLVTPVYFDLSALVGNTTVVPSTVTLELGTDGAVTAADYEALIPVFDETDDIWLLAANLSDNDFNVALASYAQLRNDIIAVCYLGDDDDVDDIIALRNTAGADHSSVSYWMGTISISNPDFSSPNRRLTVSIVGSILAASGKSDVQYGPWYSFSGETRGRLTYALGVTNNFGTKAKRGDLQKLASNQINLVVDKNGKRMLWHGFTSQRAESKKSFISIVKLVYYVQRAIGPVYEKRLEDPLDLVLVRLMWDEIKPFLDGLTSESKRALFSYTYQGDQFIGTVDKLVTNDPVDFGQGKYKVKLRLDTIAPLQEVEVTIILDRSGVSFE